MAASARTARDRPRPCAVALAIMALHHAGAIASSPPPRPRPWLHGKAKTHHPPQRGVCSIQSRVTGRAPGRSGDAGERGPWGFVVIRCHSLSFVVIRCHSLCIRCRRRWEWVGRGWRDNPTNESCRPQARPGEAKRPQRLEGEGVACSQACAGLYNPLLHVRRFRRGPGRGVPVTRVGGPSDRRTGPLPRRRHPRATGYTLFNQRIRHGYALCRRYCTCPPEERPPGAILFGCNRWGRLLDKGPAGCGGHGRLRRQRSGWNALATW
jgi:hypothetical protein